MHRAVGFLLLGAATAASIIPQALAGVSRLDTQTGVLNRFGPPDVVQSTMDQRPHPPYLVKAFIYWPEGIRFVFVPSAPIVQEGAKVDWKLKGILDERSQEGLTIEDAQDRLWDRLENQQNGEID